MNSLKEGIFLPGRHHKIFGGMVSNGQKHVEMWTSQEANVILCDFPAEIFFLLGPSIQYPWLGHGQFLKCFISGKHIFDFMLTLSKLIWCCELHMEITEQGHSNFHAEAVNICPDSDSPHMLRRGITVWADDLIP